MGAVAVIVLVAFLATGWLPARRVDEIAEEVARTEPPDDESQSTGAADTGRDPDPIESP